MRLESIALHGFKSFGEKTVVRVLPGITGIVGPNGCGKSNISEAVRWALGEQSAKSLRGQRMEDLIFHGSQSRKPVGLAEVELTFRNDGTLSVPWAEVSVARRLYRTGESEYLLNGGAARLRDILDLFAGTGANPRAYSVIDQDKLNHVLTAKPHDRRVFIEEAAGIARYKQQRNETQGKLDATKQNLVRVRDVMDEVKRQLASLERQAKKAQQYKALQTTKRDLSLVVVAAEYMARVAEGERLAAERSSASGSRRATTGSRTSASRSRRCRASSSGCSSGASRWVSSSGSSARRRSGSTRRSARRRIGSRPSSVSVRPAGRRSPTPHGSPRRARERPTPSPPTLSATARPWPRSATAPRRRGSSRSGSLRSASTSCGTRGSCESVRRSSAGARSDSRSSSARRRPRRRGSTRFARASPRRVT